VPEPLVSNISDTARWVAAYRAQESARPDALFKDALADKLAGEKGRAIAAGVARRAHRGWSVVVRTKLIDDLVLGSVGEGCDRVINLAAGLDTRPYRLALPASLTWIEADLPALVDEKEQLLAKEKPVCRLVREKVDLADAEARDAFLTRALGPALRALVITEGLLPYLERGLVKNLGRDLVARSAVRWWISDLLSPAVVEMLKKDPAFERAPMRFAPPEGVAFFEAMGWRVRDALSIFRAALGYHRAPWFMRPFGIFPDANPRKLGSAKWAAVVRCERKSATPVEAKRPGQKG
jgi:methyltransferase (TIGR00027 family)